MDTDNSFWMNTFCRWMELWTEDESSSGTGFSPINHLRQYILDLHLMSTLFIQISPARLFLSEVKTNDCYLQTAGLFA